MEHIIYNRSFSLFLPAGKTVLMAFILFIMEK